MLSVELLHFVLDDVLVLNDVREVADVIVFLGQSSQLTLDRGGEGEGEGEEGCEGR